VIGKPLIQVALQRFDVDVSTVKELKSRNERFWNTDSVYESATRYFQKRMQEVFEDIHRAKPVFVSRLFHVLVGYLLTGGGLPAPEREALINYLRSLQSPAGGFFVTRLDYVGQFPNLGRAKQSPMVPEIYPTYYAYQALKVLEAPLASEELDKLLAWILLHQHTSGLVYSTEYSDTQEARRFPSEKAGSLYFAIELTEDIVSQLPSSTTEVDFSVGVEWVLANLSGFKTIAAKYFGIKVLERLAPERICTVGIQELLGFLADRESPDADGYFNYRLEDKMDESMTTASVTEFDRISPHVFSTCYAFTILRYLKNLCNADIPFDKDVLVSLVQKATNPDNGFGIGVHVKQFTPPYGPVTTDLETLLVICLPLLTP
jgi:prenyltransferase beta subunit